MFKAKVRRNLLATPLPLSLWMSNSIKKKKVTQKRARKMSSPITI